MAWPHYSENPPTAGLPIKWGDWIPQKKKLTTEISHILNIPIPELTCSGTAALVIALKMLSNNTPTKQDVIIPAYTCPLVALAIHHCGLNIKLCDLAEDSFDFDFNHLTTLLDDNVLAVVPTHLGGKVADVAKLKKLTAVHNIAIIEDAAQALGAEVGIHGDITFFSLAAGKGLTLYEGGLLTSSDPHIREQLAHAAKELIPNNFWWELKRTIELLGYTALYNPFGLHFVYGQPRRKSLMKHQLIEAVGDDFDFNLPLHQVSNFRQYVAANAAQRLPEFIHRTRDQALQRIDQLHNINKVLTITDTNGMTGTWPFLMLLFPSKQIRDSILNDLWYKPLGVSRLFIHALPDYQYLSSIIPHTAVPNAQNFADRMLTITNSLWLTNEQFKSIYQVIHQYV